MEKPEKVTLVVFTCEGREHLLERTLSSFRAVCGFEFDEFILVIDGPYSPGTAAKAGAGLVVHSPRRKGYVNSITSALQLVKTPYFFWLEDDWLFHRDPDIPALSRLLDAHPGWAQVVHSKYEEFPPAFTENPVGNDLYRLEGFSANPSLCFTGAIRPAFHLPAGAGAANKGYEGFEGHVSGYLAANNMIPVILDPGRQPVISHEGTLESTARTYHSINYEPANDSGTVSYISGFGSDRKISAGNKLAMSGKLFVAALYLAVSLFRRREAYDYALRIYLAYLKNFKS